MAEDRESNWAGADRRSGDERRRDDRRAGDAGPPQGLQERRTGQDRRLFDRRQQGTTTGELLVEVGRFAAENMTFRQKGNKAAARRARKHLSQIMKLAKRRRAEISGEVRGNGAGDSTDNGAEGDE
jgi:hypothetical protein